MMQPVVRSLFVILSLAMRIEPVSAESRGDLLLVQGSPGTAEYGELFAEWSKRIQNSARRGELHVAAILPKTDSDQKSALLEEFSQLKPDSNLPLWIVLIGHGTYDGRAAKLNLEGPDLSAQELDTLLAPFSRTTILINCASASAPFMAQLSQANRIILTSTRSGDQVNFARFGEAFSQAIGGLAADLDKDQQTSLLEAFLSASRKTLEFYEADGRIPTEDALLDDNGDGKGTRATAFQGIRAVAQPEEAGVLLDGFRAHQLHFIANDTERDLPAEVLERRDQLERSIELLRLKKTEMAEANYYSELEKLFLEMAQLLLPPQAGSEEGPIP